MRYMSGDTVFTKLDLHSGYCQVPVNQEDQEETAFSPGPGMGLFQFKRMPFGLCGASSTFQRLMNIVMRGLPFVTTYQDNVLIHSPSEDTHEKYLREAVQRLWQAGLRLHGSKCQIGVAQVVYLGHVFSAEEWLQTTARLRRPGMAQAQRCKRSKAVHRPCILLPKIGSALCRHCKIPPQVDAKRYHILLDWRMRASL